MRNSIALLFRWELKQQLRGSTGMALMLAVPLLLAPAMVVGGAIYKQAIAPPDAAEGQEGTNRTVRAVAMPRSLAAVLTESDGLELSEGTVPTEGPLDTVLATVTLNDGVAEVRYRPDVGSSRDAAKRLRRVVKRYSRRQVRDQLEAAGLPRRTAELLKIETIDRATEAARAGGQAGALVPAVLLLVLLVNCLYAAADLVTGEKERGTIETLLSTPLDRRAVVASKFAVVLLFGVGSALIALVALFVTTQAAPTLAAKAGLAGLTAGGLLALVGVATLLSAQIAAITLLLAAWSPSYRAFSMLSMPVMLVLMIPAGLPALPEVELSLFLAITPIANACVASRDLLSGTAQGGAITLALVSGAAHAAILLGFAWRLLGREDVLLGSMTARRRTDHAREALAVGLIGLVLVWFFGQLIQSIDLAWGLAGTQVLLIAGLAVASLAVLNQPLAETCSLRRPSANNLLLAVVAGLSLPMLGQVVAHLQAPFVSMPEEFAREFAQQIHGDRSFGLTLLLVAVLPAFCEELLFRGAILGLTRGAWRNGVRVVVVALLFGLFHLMAARIVPTAALGLLLGFATVRSRSLWTSITMHGLNNGLGVVTLYLIPEWEPGWLLLIGGSAVCVAAVTAMQETE